jgi:hypothetical protein
LERIGTGDAPIWRDQFVPFVPNLLGYAESKNNARFCRDANSYVSLATYFRLIASKESLTAERTLAVGMRRTQFWTSLQRNPFRSVSGRLLLTLLWFIAARYLKTENEILKRLLNGRRLRLTDCDRRPLGDKRQRAWTEGVGGRCRYCHSRHNHGMASPIGGDEMDISKLKARAAEHSARD